MKRILCLWFPNWPIQRLLVANPELKGQPTALYALTPRRGQRVVYVSRLARNVGVRSDMSLAEAEALITDQRPSKKMCLYWEEHDHIVDRDTLEQLATTSQQFSPLVGLENSESPSCLLLDITHSATRLGGEKQLMQQVATLVHKHHYHSHIAVAGTVGAAWALAHYGNDDFDRDNFNNRDIPTFNNQQLITDQTQLVKLPVESLRLDFSTINLLHQLGIKYIQDLLTLPRHSLLSRFGRDLLKRLDQTLGNISEPIVAFSPAPPLEQSWTLEHSTTHCDTIGQIVMYLLSQLVEQLDHQQRGVIQLQCCMHCDGNRRLDFQTGLYQPTSSVEDLTELLRIQLEQRTLPGPVHHITLTATTTSQRRDQQSSLLDGQQTHAPHVLSQLLNRLGSRLGRDTVVGVRLLPEAQAERAFHYVSLIGDTSNHHRITPSSSATAHRYHHCAGWRPLKLNTTPIPLQAIGTTSCGTPISFRHDNRSYQITHYWGPERVETGWWRDALVQQDYYRVQDQFGCRFWMFLRLADRQWFLHGEFV